MRRRMSMPDGIRVLAIALVMSFHIWQQSWLEPVIRIGGAKLDLSFLVRTGYMMVDIMLMLSGYLLFLPVVRGEECRALPFYRKRLIRILPCYYLSVLVMLFCFALPNHEYAAKGAMWKDVLSHLTLTHTFFADTYISTRLNVVLWTLAIEMQFYLLFPLLARIFRKAPAPTYAVMVLIALAFRRFAGTREQVDLYLNQLPAMLDVYANGMLAATVMASLEKKPRSVKRECFFTAVLLFAFLAVGLLLKGQYADSFPMESRKAGQLARRFELSAFGALILISGESSFLFIRSLFSNPVTRFLSAISYNAYIWHQVLAVKLKEWRIPNYLSENPNASGEIPWQVSYTVLCAVLSLALAAAITFVFERPLNGKLAKLTNRVYNKGKRSNKGVSEP